MSLIQGWNIYVCDNLSPLSKCFYPHAREIIDPTNSCEDLTKSRIYHVASKLKYKGFDYSNGIVISSTILGEHKFGKIVAIIVSNNHDVIHLALHLLDAQNNSDTDCIMIKPSNVFFCINIDDVENKYPLQVYQYHGVDCLILKHVPINY